MMPRIPRSKPLMITFIILSGLLISSIILAFVTHGDLAPLFFIALITWTITLLGSILYAMKSLRTFLTVLGLNLIAVPFAIFFATRTEGSANVPTFFFSMAAWSIISGLITRSAKYFYWTLHLSAWLVGFGLSTLPVDYSGSFTWYWILFPIGASIALFSQYNTIINNLSRWSFFRDTQVQPQSPAGPQPSFPSYDHGYQPAQSTAKAAYEEAGKLYPYPEQATHEQIQAQYPQGMIQS